MNSILLEISTTVVRLVANRVFLRPQIAVVSAAPVKIPPGLQHHHMTCLHHD